MTHTPGPWKVGYSLFDKTRVTCVATGHSVLLESSRMYGREETEANMRLCAAAPELLEACEAWHSYSEHARLCDVKPQHHKSLGDVVCADCFKLEVTALKLGAIAIAKVKGDG